MKRCTGCGELKSLADYSPDGRTADGCQPRCRRCKADYGREKYNSSPEEAQAVRCRVRKGDEALRAAVFGHYGQSCACCGTTEDLAIDHVSGGGRAHRDQLANGGRGGHGGQFYRWLIKNGFPPGFQTLCNPCNASKKETDRCRLDHPRKVNAA